MRAHRILIQTTGSQFMADETTTLLQAAKQAGIDLPRSCQNGTCRACICRLLSGQIRYRIAWPGLSAEERAQGAILPCVAYAQSDVVLVPGA